MHRDPVPRIEQRKYQPFNWPAGDTFLLPSRNQSLEIDLVELLEQRETRREFKVPLEDAVLGEFLWLACRNRSIRPSPFGTHQESRVHPSAGAMHPIHVVLARRTGPWMRYDPVEHALIDLPRSDDSAAASREAASRLVPLGQAVLIGLIAEPGKTAVKYESHETLVWRDAGVVIGYMSLIAEALRLSFCPLGITGRPHLTSFVPKRSGLEATGIAVLGRS